MAELNLKEILYLDCIQFLYIFNKITFHCGYEKKYFSYMYINHPVIVCTLKRSRGS